MVQIDTSPGVDVILMYRDLLSQELYESFILGIGIGSPGKVQTVTIYGLQRRLRNKKQRTVLCFELEVEAVEREPSLP